MANSPPTELRFDSRCPDCGAELPRSPRLISGGAALAIAARLNAEGVPGAGG